MKLTGPAGLEPYTATPTWPLPLPVTLTLPASSGSAAGGDGRVGADANGGPSHRRGSERHGEGFRLHRLVQPGRVETEVGEGIEAVGVDAEGPKGRRAGGQVGGAAGRLVEGVVRLAHPGPTGIGGRQGNARRCGVPVVSQGHHPPSLPRSSGWAVG